MKVVAAVLRGILLAMAPIYSLQKCEKETQEIRYYIYNANVEDKAYYCSYSDKDDSKCKNYNGTLLDNHTPGITHDCYYNGFIKFIRDVLWKRTKINLCEVKTRVHLLDDILKSSKNTICLYSNGKCHATGISKKIFWTVHDICENMALIHYGTFSVWKTDQDQTTFIDDNRVSLILREKLNTEACELWKTNHKGIVASKDNIPSKRRAELPMLRSDQQTFCESKKKGVEESKIWYVYSYPINVTIHMCVSQKSCADMNIDVTDDPSNLLNRCKDNFCDSDECRNVCSGSFQIDVETNSIRDIHSNCNYSDGFCKEGKAFWDYKDPCNFIQELYRINVTQSSGGMYEIQEYNLTLLREGKLCGKSVWFTNRNGFVASETELQSSHLPQDDSSDYASLMVMVDQQNQEIELLQILLYCVTLFVVVCVLWYIFNVAVNFFSLRKLNEKQTSKRKAQLMCCVSQGLTAHYLCVDEQEKIELKEIPGVQSEQYESVDNELYKPVK